MVHIPLKPSKKKNQNMPNSFKLAKIPLKYSNDQNTF